MQTLLDLDTYRHGSCETFAIFLQGLFGGEVVLCLDEEYEDYSDNYNTVLVHAFLQIPLKGVGHDYLYMDAYGVYLKVEDVLSMYDYGDYYLYTDTLEKVKQKLRSLKIPYGGEPKKALTKWSRETMLRVPILKKDKISWVVVSCVEGNSLIVKNIFEYTDGLYSSMSFFGSYEEEVAEYPYVKMVGIPYKIKKEDIYRGFKAIGGHLSMARMIVDANM